MNRELISKAIGDIDGKFIEEAMTCPSAKPRRAPERTKKMGKYESSHSGHGRRLFSLILAACLVFALAVTAYAASRFSLREMFHTFQRDLPQEADPYIETHTAAAQEADPYIETHTAAAQEENWSARVTESLCDGSKLLVNVQVSGGTKYILAPTDAAPTMQLGWIGLTGEQTLEEYAAQEGKELLFVGAMMRHESTEDLGIFTESQIHKYSSPTEMNILIESDMANPTTEFDAICTVYARTTDPDAEIIRLELPVSIHGTQAEETFTFVPRDPEAIPGITVSNVMVEKTPLGYTLSFTETVTDQEAAYGIMRVTCDEIDFPNGGGVIIDGKADKTAQFSYTMGQGSFDDTLTLRFDNWDKEPIGFIVFDRQ